MASTTWISSGRAAAAAILQVLTYNNVMPLSISICTALQYHLKAQGMVMHQLQEQCAVGCAPSKVHPVFQHLRAGRWCYAMHKPLRLPCTAPVWYPRLYEPSFVMCGFVPLPGTLCIPAQGSFVLAVQLPDDSLVQR